MRLATESILLPQMHDGSLTDACTNLYHAEENVKGKNLQRNKESNFCVHQLNGQS